MTEQEFAREIGATVGLFPTQVANLLNANGVVVDAQNLSISKLVDATFIGLKTSKGFYESFKKLNIDNTEVINSVLKK